MVNLANNVSRSWPEVITIGITRNCEVIDESIQPNIDLKERETANKSDGRQRKEGAKKNLIIVKLKDGSYSNFWQEIGI